MHDPNLKLGTRMTIPCTDRARLARKPRSSWRELQGRHAGPEAIQPRFSRCKWSNAGGKSIRTASRLKMPRRLSQFVRVAHGPDPTGTADPPRGRDGFRPPFRSTDRSVETAPRNRTVCSSKSLCNETRCRFGRNRRRVLLWAWPTWLPVSTPFPVSSQRRDM